MTRHTWDKKYFNVDKKIQDKSRNNRENDRNDKNTAQSQGQTGQSMSQREKPEQKKVCFKCGKEGHLSPDCPLGHMPKEEWWINKQSRASAHQKARCMELADLKVKEREEQQEESKENNTSKKTVKWSGSQIRGPLPIRK